MRQTLKGFSLRKLFPTSLWTRQFTIAWAGCFVTILTFDLLWSMATSFRGLGFAATYLFGALLALLMAMPAAISRGRWLMGVGLAVADLLAIANLMYCRTYFGPIPPASYFLAGNVAEFGDAIRHSLRLADLLFPLITFLTLLLMGRCQATAREPRKRGVRAYVATLLTGAVACMVCVLPYGGLFRHIDHLKEECYYRATPPVVYTLPLSILADLLESNRPVSEEEIASARKWLKEGESFSGDSIPPMAYKPDNVVMIIVESLEAWPLQKSVEGKEITPCLNRLLADTASTWFAPRVLSQVGPGRSIDGQLLMTAGLLPMPDYVYSMRFPEQDYPHLAKELES